VEKGGIMLVPRFSSVASLAKFNCSFLHLPQIIYMPHINANITINLWWWWPWDVRYN